MNEPSIDRSPESSSCQAAPSHLAADHRAVGGSAPASTALLAVVGVVITIGTMARLWAATDEMWLDEIWSWARTELINSPTQVFTAIRHDNNHHLVTLWMYFWGFREHWIVYRLPSLAAGVGTMVLATIMARSAGPLATLTAAALTASSYLLILYGSEARGYALAGFFALAGCLALERFLVSCRWLPVVMFWGAVTLGYLSHLTFVHFHLGAIAWSLAALHRRTTRWSAFAWALVQLHAVPILVLAAFYFVSLRGMEFGGSDPHSTLQVLFDAAAQPLGGRSSAPIMTWLLAAVSLVCGYLAIDQMRREKCDLWVQFAVTVFVSPALICLLSRATGIYVRYFYIPILFELLLVSYLTARLWRSVGLAPIFALLVVAVAVVRNVADWQDFSQGGRGQYLVAMRYMADHTTDDTIRIEADSPRTELVVVYAAAHAHVARNVEHGKSPRGPSGSSEWYVTHSELPGWRPAAALRALDGKQFDLQGIFRHAGLSGFDWAVYRRAQP